MAINKKLIFWKSATFNPPTSSTDTTKDVLWSSIVFFDSTAGTYANSIWTHGQVFSTGTWGTNQTNYVPLTLSGTTYNLSKDGHTHSYAGSATSGGSAYTSKALIGGDTRSVNSAPSAYMSGGTRYVGYPGSQIEFKQVSVIEAQTFISGTYCILETKTPWSDSSGGRPIQFAYGAGTICWRIATDDSTWGAWKAINSGGDADLLDGYHASSSATANTIALRDSNGYLYVAGLNSTLADTTTAATHYYVETGSDGLLRPKTLADVKTEIVTKAAVEASLIGAITSHTHSYLPLSGGTLTGPLTINNSVAGDGGWDDAGIIIKNNNATAGEAAVSFQNVSTGTNYWIQGINQSSEYKIAYGNAFIDTNAKLVLDINGQLWNGNLINKYWHAGNDGSGSGLDADTLDTLHSSDYVSKSYDIVLSQYNQYFYMQFAQIVIPSGTTSYTNSWIWYMYGYEVGDMAASGHIRLSIKRESNNTVNTYNFSTFNLGTAKLPPLYVTSADGITFQVYYKVPTKTGYSGFFKFKTIQGDNVLTASGTHITTDTLPTGTLYSWTAVEANSQGYITGNQTISLTGIITGSGTTSIATAIADSALSIAKTSGLQTALDGKLPLSGGTLSGSLNVTALAGLNYSGIGTNYNIAPGVSNVSSTPVAGFLWHDLFAFTKIYTTTFETSADGITYTPATLNKDLFAQKEAQSISILNYLTTKSVRWKFTNVAWGYGAWLILGFSYVSETVNKTITVETSTDNTNWTSRHTSAGTWNAKSVWFYITPYEGDAYMRITITYNSGNQNVNLASMRLLTSRWGDQGAGSEYSYPYTWDANQNITAGGTITASTFYGSLNGNATSATSATSAGKWTSARTVTFATGDISGSFAIDGSADVSNVNLQVADNSHNHTSLTGVTSFTFAAPSGDPSPTITSRVVPTTQGGANDKSELILFHSNDGVNGSGVDQITLRAPGLSFQTYTDSGVSTISADAGYNERLYIAPNGAVTISQTLAVTNGITADLTGNALTATTWKSSRTLTIGASGKSVNGAGDVSWSLAEIGAAESVHTHNYLPLVGGNLTGAITISNQAAINTTAPGTQLYGLHFLGQSTSDYATGITWNGGNTGAQAGIYVQGSGSYGTKMYIATTDAYLSGSKTAISIDHTGLVNFERVRPKALGNLILDVGNYNSYALPLSGGTLTGGIEIQNVLSGTSYASSEGFYTAEHNNIILRGDSTYGKSGILFTSSKGVTSINQTSDKGFIQFQSYSGTATSGESNKLVIGVGNDADDMVYIQTPGANGLKHVVGTTAYTIWDENNDGPNSGLYAQRADISNKVYVTSGFVGTYPIIVNVNNELYAKSGFTYDGSTNTLNVLNINATSISGTLAGTSSYSLKISGSASLTTQGGDGTTIYGYALTNPQTGLFPAVDNSNAILTINRHPGNYYSQLGFSSNGNMYYRSFSAVAIDTTKTWNVIWTNGNHGLGSGLDADLLDGYHADTAASANTVVRRDSNGYIYGVSINSNRGDETSTAASYIYDTGDGWMRKKTLANTQTEIVTKGAIEAAVVNGVTTGKISSPGYLPTSIINQITDTTLRYGKVAEIELTTIWAAKTIVMRLTPNYNGGQTNSNATISLQVKQGAAFGQDPSVSLVILQTTGLLINSSFVAVVVQNTPTTKVQLFVKNSTAYDGHYIVLLSGSCTTFSNETLITTLPAGTAFTGTYANSYATTFYGSLNGNASSATYASAVTLTADNSTDATNYPLFVNAATGNLSPRTDTGFTYNPSTGVLTATTFVGSLNGTANSANSATTATTAGSISGWNNPPLNNNGGTWPHLVGVKSDGVTEIGQYLDFHGSSAEGSDYAIRLTNSSGTLLIGSNTAIHSGNYNNYTSRTRTSSYLAAGAGWYRVANTNGGNHGAMIITLYGYTGGMHAAAKFVVTSHHGHSSITQIAGDTSSGSEFTSVRTAYNTADRVYGGHAFEVYYSGAYTIYYSIEDVNVSNMYNEWIFGFAASDSTYTADKTLADVTTYALQSTNHPYSLSSHTHNYAGSSSAGGAANSVAASLTFNSGGAGAASGTTFNGSTAQTISYNTIGAAALSHTHSYLPLSGGVLTGNIEVTYNSGVTGSTAPSYSQTNVELVTSSNNVPALGFHRSGTSATTLYEYDGELYVNAWTARAQTGKLLSSGNYNSYAPTLNGTGATGTWAINVSGKAATLNVYTSNEVVLGDGFTGGRLYVNYRGSTSAITEYYMCNGLGSTLTQVTASGFAKSGSNNNYTLLGGGGHKPLSEFMTDAGGSYSGLIYNLQPKTMFSGLNITDAPTTGWVSGIVLADNWNPSHYQRYIVVAGDNMYYGNNANPPTWFTMLHSTNYSNYALPKTGGTITGNLTISNTAPGLLLTDTDLLTAALITEVNGQIIDFGTNYSQSGVRNSSYRGGFFSIDTRDTQASEFFNIKHIPANGSEAIIFKVSTAGAVVASSTITATAFYESSDLRLKTNIESIDDKTTDLIFSEDFLKSFTRKDRGYQDYGVIAQHIETYFPDLVSTSDTGFKHVKYSAVLSMIMGASIKKIKSLEERIIQLENK